MKKDDKLSSQIISARESCTGKGAWQIWQPKHSRARDEGSGFK